MEHSSNLKCEWHCIVLFEVSLHNGKCWNVVPHFTHLYINNITLDSPYKTVSEGFPLTPTYSNFYTGVEKKSFKK